MGRLAAVMTSCRKYCARIVVGSLAVTVVTMLHFTKFHFLTPVENMYVKDSNNYLIYTPGCRIPYLPFFYNQPHKSHPAENCGKRSVLVKKTSDTEIKLTILTNDFRKHKRYTCCYRFAFHATTQGEKNIQIKYTDCKLFMSGAKVPLDHEILEVECRTKKKSIYKDSYILVKKQLTENATSATKWNVLIMGIDTVSRARAHNEMTRTVQYMKKREGWLDFKGYQKVATNTYPNMMSFLTGEESATSSQTCDKGMNLCNHKLMWSHYKRAGYTTAYGEDHIKMDTFGSKGYRLRPTHHYMRPFFLTGEEKVGPSLCAHKRPTIQTLVDYAFDFAVTYKNEQFFGLFWSNANTHNPDDIGAYNDIPMERFLQNLEKAGILSNTIVILLSDHGRRFGTLREPIEGYYDDGLPMLFMWLPLSFRQQYAKDFNNALRNQIRLVTPYDLYMTLRDIVGRVDSSVTIPRSAGCPRCNSIFSEIPLERTCQDVGVDTQFCTCYRVTPVDWKRNRNGQAVVDAVVAELQRMSARTEVRKCYICVRPRLKKVLRVHKYSDEGGAQSYIVAIEMSPGNSKFEMYASQKADGTIQQRGSTSTLKMWNSQGSCVVHKHDNPFCYCRYQCNYSKKSRYS